MRYCRAEAEAEDGSALFCIVILHNGFSDSSNARGDLLLLLHVRWAVHAGRLTLFQLGLRDLFHEGLISVWRPTSLLPSSPLLTRDSVSS